MLNDLFLPFASMPATVHHHPKSPSILEGFTLHYDEKRLNVRVDETHSAIEIEIESFHNFFGPHMVGAADNKWAIKFGATRSALLASIVDDRWLLFAEIPTKKEARELLGLIDLIIRTNQQHRQMIRDLEDLYNEELVCEWQVDSSSLHVYGQRGNVSVYNVNNLVLVYIQSDDAPYIFERYLSPEFAPVGETDSLSSYVLSYDDKHFPGAEYVEDEIYMFCFHFPRDEAQIRMLVDTAVKIIKTNVK